MAVVQENVIRLDDTGLTDEELFTQIPQDTAAVEKITAPRYSYWHSVFRVFFRKKSNIVILALFAIIIIFTYIYPLINGFDRYGNLMDSDTKHLTPAAAIEKFGFSIRWIFGTGANGQSTFDSMWYGARISLSLAFLCALINFSIGIVVGAVWGFSKKVDLVMNEIRNVVGNVPGTLIISVWVLVFSPSFATLLFAMCVTGWIGVAYGLRTQVIIIRDREYNLASKCLGSSTLRIAVKNILPFMISFIVTVMAQQIPAYIASEAFLSYIPLHPYTRSLISAIPLPDPQLEKHKVLFTYDPSTHNYSDEMKPELTFIGHDHYVYGSPEEIAAYKSIRERNVPLKTLSIVGVNAEAPEKGEEESMATHEVILDRPIHDTGSALYVILSFFLPLIGLIAAYLFLKHNHIRNFKACRKGALAFFICLGVLILLLGLLILAAVM